MKQFCSVSIAFSFAACACFIASASDAAQKTNPLAVPVAIFQTAYNAGDLAFPSRAFTSDGPVIDEFFPFAWYGKGGARAWYAQLVGANSKSARSRFSSLRGHVVYGDLQQVEVRNGRAYLVVPGTLTYYFNRRTRTQHGLWTVTEVKRPDGWRIDAQAWAILDDK